MIRLLAIGMMTGLTLHLATTTDATAHAVLAVSEAPVGSSYKAVIAISHGCDGASTTSVRVSIPEGIIAVKPMPKHGWTVSVAKQRYDRTYEFFHGMKLNEGVTEITWSHGRLADDHYDEFVFSAYVAKELQSGSTLHFPVIQTCEKGEHKWIEIPNGDQDTHKLKSPAPRLMLGPPKHTHH